MADGYILSVSSHQLYIPLLGTCLLIELIDQFINFSVINRVINVDETREIWLSLSTGKGKGVLCIILIIKHETLEGESGS